MNLSFKNWLYALRYPAKALRYLKWRDTIPFEQIAGFLPADPVILEAGASNGKHTAEMSQFWPKAKIHAFEPVPGAFVEAKKSCENLSGQIFFYPFALGEKSGELEIHLSGEGQAHDSQSSSMLPPSKTLQEFPHVHFGKTLTVKVVSIEDWARDESISHVDFLWLDLQGYELKAMQGAGNLFTGVSAVHLEVQNIPLYQGAPLQAEVVDWMHTHGFKVAISATFRVGGNVLFVRPSRT